MLGVVAGEKDLIDAIWGYSVMHGSTASPFDANNGLRGIRTLGVRLAHQCAGAQRIAETLENHPRVTHVSYPGLRSHPQHDLARRQMRRFGSVLSFDVDGGLDAARSFMSKLTLVRPAVSFGGPETLACHPASSTHVGVSADEQLASGITPGLIRLSVGLEDSDDVLADITAAL